MDSKVPCSTPQHKFNQEDYLCAAHYSHHILSLTCGFLRSHQSLAVCFQFNQPDYAIIFLSQSYQCHQTLNLFSSLLMSGAILVQIVAPLVHPIHLRCPRSELTGSLSSSNPSKFQHLSNHLHHHQRQVPSRLGLHPAPCTASLRS